MGVGDTFRMTPVGVYFGPNHDPQPGVEVDDPFFGGAGPRRRGCIEVGECMTGCRHNATSSIHPDDKTHIEPVRYGKGTQSMGLLTTVMTDGGGHLPRWLRWMGQVLRHPAQAVGLCRSEELVAAHHHRAGHAD